MYDMVARTRLGEETPEHRTVGLNADEVADILVRALELPRPPAKSDRQKNFNIDQH